jgi:hypothetical protein
MSDLQILTGLSILISGYVQLSYGITCWHWQQLVYLAWFSSVTHQACLTFLRPYLHQHPTERTWRLVLMGIMCSMLIGALVPTANYEWGQGLPELQPQYSNDDYERPYPADYALCYYGVPRKADDLSIASVAISISFIVVGYTARVVRLHRTLSVRVMGGAREAISTRVQRILRLVHRATHVENSLNRLLVLCIYRPLSAVFLAFRILLDLWTSMFFEVRPKSAPSPKPFFDSHVGLMAYS